MLTVQEVADRYVVSIKFMVAALDKIGVRRARPDTPLSAVTVQRFEKEWGEKIRAARRSPAPSFTGETEVVVRPSDKPKPHVMRISHAKIGGKREGGLAVKALLDNPGMVHAIDAVGTWHGDPWNGAIRTGDVHYFGGPMNSGPTAACGRRHMRAVLSDEFVPEDHPEKAGQCPQCAQIVTEGKGFRNPPREYESPFCEDYIRIKIDDNVGFKNCTRLGCRHTGPHRASDGAEWETGVDDYVPAPDEVGCTITEAS